MFKNKFKNMQMGENFEKRGFEVISDNEASALVGGCGNLKKCSQYTGSCTILGSCGQYAKEVEDSIEPTP